MVGPRLPGQDRALLFGLGAGLFIGLLVGARRFAPFAAVIAGLLIVAVAYGLLRVTRGVRSTPDVPVERERIGA
jgi:hypothetical protein